MNDFKLTVALTSNNSENMSRHEMLNWVNNLVNGQFKKIEELRSGVAYCQMMELIFPNCINLRRVKMGAKLEHEFLHNLKLFQAAFTRLKLDKTVPIDRLMKGRFQDNFEFLQWFKKFFDSQAPGLENMKSAANCPTLKPIKPRVLDKSCPRTVEPNADGNLTVKDLMCQIDEMNNKAASVIERRDHAYSKLRKIEVMLNEQIEENENIEFCQRIFHILSTTEFEEDVTENVAAMVE
ncbi:microtubule-associated protein RP/EB family member 2 [Scaptodrosophila lebanonensis]|uniref:Microtubule-associated protein RP/EB family member 2 n=1 Tax=Drosophila lebanonensis TaxID=7225 RepID=A0A6J2UJS0_DROLE|nr:microtubule-associated protein RP/EB family member 2 [Scaptodrosophila lebanonensis]